MSSGLVELKYCPYVCLLGNQSERILMQLDCIYNIPTRRRPVTGVRTLCTATDRGAGGLPLAHARACRRGAPALPPLG